MTATYELELQSTDKYQHVWDAFALPVTYLTWSAVLLMITFTIFLWTSGLSTDKETTLPLWSLIVVVAGTLHPVCCSFQAMKTVKGLCQTLVETPAADKV
jgi:hypothetical protein